MAAYGEYLLAADTPSPDVQTAPPIFGNDVFRRTKGVSRFVIGCVGAPARRRWQTRLDLRTPSGRILPY